MLKFMQFIKEFLVLIAIALACASGSSAFAWVVTVDIRVDNSAGSAYPGGLGDNWGLGHAYKYLQDALARAIALLTDPLNPADNVRIFVAAGTYKPDQNADWIAWDSHHLNDVDQADVNKIRWTCTGSNRS